SVDDRFRGRVSALDSLGMTLSFTTFGLVAGLAADSALGNRGAIALAVVLLALSALAWNVATRPIFRARSQPGAHDPPPHP
ncbi:MAG: hypothetical protein AAFZ65_07575, partial [Planctomycetota bacterium]